MAICEADPWRLQYFKAVPCPVGVDVPTEGPDAWVWFPNERWVYDKLAVARSQGIAAAPHGVIPPAFPVFSKPLVNLRGMGIGSRVIATEDDYRRALTPGHFWMELLRGAHVSTDVAVCGGEAVWWRHATGLPRRGGTFDHWVVHAEAMPAIEIDCGAWIARHLPNYTGMLNLETIGGRIIEVHLRFADQWPDLYGEGWVAALIELYAARRWEFADNNRRTGYSVVLFGPNGRRYHHPNPTLVAQILARPAISSVQITFYEDREPRLHAMPPGGFRLAIVNCTDLEAGRAARAELRAALLHANRTGTSRPRDPRVRIADHTDRGVRADG